MPVKVYIPGGDMAIEFIFKAHGYEIVEAPKNADLIQFSGGADIDPKFYNEHQHPHTYLNHKRDIYEEYIYKYALKEGKAMAGICRGGQLLHAMNGGKLYQHVDNHASFDGHMCVDAISHTTLRVSSTHHQMMRLPVEEYTILAYAEGVAECKEWMVGEREIMQEACDDKTQDLEAIFYPSTQCLCFQGHPEYANYTACTELYFSYIKNFLKL